MSTVVISAPTEAQSKPKKKSTPAAPPATAPPHPSSLLAEIKAASQTAQLGDVDKAETTLKRIVRTVRSIIDDIRSRDPMEQSKPVIAVEEPSFVAQPAGEQDGDNAAPQPAATVLPEELATKDEWTRLLALALHNLASIQKRQNKLKRALKSADEAHQLELATGNPSPATMLNLIVLYTAVGEFEWALDTAESAINVMAGKEGIGPGMWGAVYHNKAVAMLQLLMRFGEGSPAAVYVTLEKAIEFATNGGERTVDLLNRIEETEAIVLTQFGPQQTRSVTPRRSRSSQVAPSRKTQSEPQHAFTPSNSTITTQKAAGKKKGKSGPHQPLSLPSINKKHVMDAMHAHQKVNHRFSKGLALQSTLPDKLRRSSQAVKTSAHAGGAASPRSTMVPNKPPTKKPPAARPKVSASQRPQHDEAVAEDTTKNAATPTGEQKGPAPLEPTPPPSRPITAASSRRPSNSDAPSRPSTGSSMASSHHSPPSSRGPSSEPPPRSPTPPPPSGEEVAAADEPRAAPSPPEAQPEGNEQQDLEDKETPNPTISDDGEVPKEAPQDQDEQAPHSQQDDDGVYSDDDFHDE